MAMEMRVFGRTGMQLSVLGFGCGAVGGLMVRGDPADQERTIARAIAAGVNYFDTAVQYGNGESEKNLGRVLQTLNETARSAQHGAGNLDSRHGEILCLASPGVNVSVFLPTR
jgi:aryl-alcohol dehydrogenase-like predicted oxidoreductase